MEIITPQDYQNNARKRKRRSRRPCDACRKRKTRCMTKDGDNDCVHCQLRATACTFQHDPPERLGRGRKESRDEPRTLGSPASLTSETQVLVSETQSVQSFLSPAETRASRDSAGRHHHAPPSVIVPELVEPDPLDLTLGCSLSRFAELYGLGSDMEPILMRHRPYDIRSHEFSLETHAIRRVLEHEGGQEHPVTFHLAADDKAVESDLTHLLVDSIERCVHPHGPSLVELFWRHIHPCYPIVSKDSFILIYSQSYRHTPPALLAAIYLSATRWWTYNPELSIHSPPDTAYLRKLLQTALSSSYHRPKLYSIQAALLLLQCQPEDPVNPNHTFQWGLTCQALAIGQCLGLHLDATNWTIPQWERNIRKRLSWALFMQDRWTALAYGRPVHIHDDDWAVKDLTPADFTDFDTDDSEVTPGPGPDDDGRSIAATGMMQFIQMVQLTKILSVVYSSFYTARTCCEQDTVLLFEKAQPLLDILTTWYRQHKLYFHGYLQFSYYGVTMILLRRLIRSTALPPSCIDDCVLSDIRRIALRTAQSAISFVTSLRPDHLKAFWYFTSSYLFSLLGSFTTLLLITSLSRQERQFWQEILNSYLRHLRIMGKSHEPMQYAVNRLEGAILCGLEHTLAVNLNEPLNDKISPMMDCHATNVYEYTDLGKWDLAVGGNGACDLLSGLAVETESMMHPNLLLSNCNIFL